MIERRNLEQTTEILKYRTVVTIAQLVAVSDLFAGYMKWTASVEQQAHSRTSN
jgi:hypothetical protein